MLRRRFLSIGALVLVLSMVAVACGGDDGPEDPDTTTTEPTDGVEPTDDDGVQEGGVYRVETDGIAYTSGGDPTGEYLGISFGLFSNLTVRTLLTYYHEGGGRGNELAPDLAVDFPEISDDGLTYTFTLKDGIMFGPPLNREITSADIEFAFRRMATESVAAQYPGYYSVIEGFEVGADPGPGGIAGIETPDDKTIVFNLTGLSPDFPFLAAMPATGAMPEEVAGCFDEPGGYGRYLISSGPYMYEGSEALDASSCDALTASGPISGFDPDDHAYFVRNDAYDAATDDPEVRANYVEEIRIDLNTNVQDIYDKIEAGELEGAVSSGNPPADVLQRYSTDPELQDRLVQGGDDRTWYITMNLSAPPFDDVHVRKAVNFVMDKAGMLQAWGGPINGEIATHIQPPALTGGPSGEEYNPYASEGFAGDVEAAMDEMSQSRYDTDGDGLCDAPECSGVVMINRNTSPWLEAEPVVVASLAEIGIQVEPREVEDHYTVIQDLSNQIPIAMNPGWGKDYPDSASFVGFLFDGRTIDCQVGYNYSVVGITPEQAEECGVDYPEEPIPSVDADIDACKETALEDPEAGVQCWVELDMRIMEEIVPWVPYLWPNIITAIGPTVTAWEFDQFSGATAWSKVAVAQG